MDSSIFTENTLNPTKKKLKNSSYHLMSNETFPSRILTVKTEEISQDFKQGSFV